MPPDGVDEREHPWEVRGANADALRRAMSHYPTGVTVVTSGREEKVEGMTANAVISVSLDPLLFLVSVHKDARLNPRIKEEGYFAVSLLADDQEGLSRLFASPERSSGLPALHSLGGGYGLTGAPLASGALGVIECELAEEQIVVSSGVDLGQLALDNAEGARGERGPGRAVAAA